MTAFKLAVIKTVSFSLLTVSGTAAYVAARLPEKSQNERPSN